jgi:ribosome maturation factor RimP
MINKDVVKTTVEEWLSGNDYFLVDVEMTPDGRIVIEIDHADGVWIEDCAELSRFLQEKLGEELGDYEVEVGSAGIGQPFKVVQQYRNHVGKEVEVLSLDGKKQQGILKEVADDGLSFVVTVKEKQKLEGKKRPVIVDVDKTFTTDSVKYTKYLLSFK